MWVEVVVELITELPESISDWRKKRRAKKVAGWEAEIAAREGGETAAEGATETGPTGAAPFLREPSAWASRVGAVLRRPFRRDSRR